MSPAFSRVSIAIAVLFLSDSCCCQPGPDHPETPLPKLASAQQLHGQAGEPLLLAVESQGGLFVALATPPAAIEQSASLSMIEPDASEMGRVEVGLSGVADATLHLSLPERQARDCSKTGPVRLVWLGPRGVELVPQELAGRELDARISAAGTYALMDVKAIPIEPAVYRAALPLPGGLARGAEAIEVLQLNGRDAEAQALLEDLDAAAETVAEQALDSMSEGADCLETMSEAGGALALAQQLGLRADTGTFTQVAEVLEACALVGEIEWDSRVLSIAEGQIADQWFEFTPPMIFHKPAGSLALSGTTHTRMSTGLRAVSDGMEATFTFDMQHDNRVVGTVSNLTVDIDRLVMSNLAGVFGMTLRGPEGVVLDAQFDLSEIESTETSQTLRMVGPLVPAPLSIGIDVQVTSTYPGLRLQLVPFHAYTWVHRNSGMLSVQVMRVAIHDESSFDCDDHNPCTQDQFLAAASTCAHQPWTGSLDSDPFDCKQVHCVDGELREDLDAAQVEPDEPGNCHSNSCDQWGEPGGNFDPTDPPAAPPDDLPGFVCSCHAPSKGLVCRKGDDEHFIDLD